jgi:hypothetical protein
MLRVWLFALLSINIFALGDEIFVQQPVFTTPEFGAQIDDDLASFSVSKDESRAIGNFPDIHSLLHVRMCLFASSA